MGGSSGITRFIQDSEWRNGTAFYVRYRSTYSEQFIYFCLFRPFWVIFFTVFRRNLIFSFSTTFIFFLVYDKPFFFRNFIIKKTYVKSSMPTSTNRISKERVSGECKWLLLCPRKFLQRFSFFLDCSKAAVGWLTWRNGFFSFFSLAVLNFITSNVYAKVPIWGCLS